MAPSRNEPVLRRGEEARRRKSPRAAEVRGRRGGPALGAWPPECAGTRRETPPGQHGGEGGGVGIREQG